MANRVKGYYKGRGIRTKLLMWLRVLTVIQQGDDVC